MESRKDKIIKSTDLDALSCRCFANKYIQDPLIDKILEGVKRYLPLSSPVNMSIQRNLKTYFNNAKTPIINRGTYIRTKSIDMVVELFLQQHHDQVQLVSIGAGSDTRFLNLLKRDDVKVFEYDFEESVKVKKLSILNDDTLRRIVKYEGETLPRVQTYEEFTQLDPILETSNYSLEPLDLRHLTPANFNNLDHSLPTLFLSECVLCYMSIDESYQVLRHITDKFDQGCFVIYEPIGGDDNFGQVMTSNLSSRGIELPSLMEFNTLQSQLQRFSSITKIDKIQISDLNFIFQHWILQQELQRISKIEFLDELEEMNLINKHYCLCVLQWGKMTFQFDHEFQINKINK